MTSSPNRFDLELVLGLHYELPEQTASKYKVHRVPVLWSVSNINIFLEVYMKTLVVALSLFFSSFAYAQFKCVVVDTKEDGSEYLNLSADSIWEGQVNQLDTIVVKKN
jgi:hypothetical protein